MELKGLEKALEEGCRLHGFRSGSGLRVIRIEKEGKLRGYGEHPNVEDALSYANEDFLAGGRKYTEVYGKLKHLYLTGSQETTSPLDSELLQGKKIDAYMKDNEVVVELRGRVFVRPSEKVIEEAKRTGQPITWQNRGYTFRTTSEREKNLTQYITTVLKSPEKIEHTDPWAYESIRIGKAKEFFEAINKALQAQELEAIN